MKVKTGSKLELVVGCDIEVVIGDLEIGHKFTIGPREDISDIFYCHRNLKYLLRCVVKCLWTKYLK